MVVIGADTMGLAAAYRASKNGHDVDLIEAAPEPGGMAGHFDFDGISGKTALLKVPRFTVSGDLR